jgi:hypothetical protein
MRDPKKYKQDQDALSYYVRTIGQGIYQPRREYQQKHGFVQWVDTTIAMIEHFLGEMEDQWTE